VELIRAIRSPVRQEILDKAQALGPFSIAELAHVVGRPADGLYYHVKALLAVGLLQPAGERGAGRRREALYQTPAPEDGLWLVYDPTDPANVGAVNGVVGGMLRLTERSFAAAFRPGAVCAGPYRDLWAVRNEGWLTDDELREVNRTLARLRELFAAPRREGSRLHALTFVLTPMVANSARRASRRKTVTSEADTSIGGDGVAGRAGDGAATLAAPPPPEPEPQPDGARPPRRGTRGPARRRGR
jgi:hypothetical protein